MVEAAKFEQNWMYKHACDPREEKRFGSWMDARTIKSFKQLIVI